MKEIVDNALKEEEAASLHEHEHERKAAAKLEILSMHIKQNLDELSRVRERLQENTDALESLTRDCKNGVHHD